MKGIYLAAFRAEHKDYNIDYQDINGQRDISGDMLKIDLSSYDYIIATPPCNYWSKARGNRLGKYAFDTSYLLPAIITKLKILNKPFIVENVKNTKRQKEFGLLDIEGIYIYNIGRHTYWTNIQLQPSLINQRQDFISHGYVIQYEDMKDKSHQGGYNVHQVIENFLKIIKENNDNKKSLPGKTQVAPRKDAA